MTNSSIKRIFFALAVAHLSLALIGLFNPVVFAFPSASSNVQKDRRLGQTSQLQSTKVLNFPADRTIGTLRFRGSTQKIKQVQARGTVYVPRGETVELLVNYQSASGLSPLSNIPADGLFGLKMGRLEITDEQLVYIKHLTGLCLLSLRETDVTDNGLDCLRDMKNLSDLNLGATLLTNKALPKLIALTGLETLLLDMTNVSDEGLESLAKMKSLKRISLAKTRITDRGLQKIAANPNLESLDIEYNSFITDNGIKYLTGLKKLNQLQLANCKVTGKCIPYLKQMSALTEIVYSKNNFSPQEVEDLRRALPHCKVEDFNDRREAPVEMFAPLH